MVHWIKRTLKSRGQREYKFLNLEKGPKIFFFFSYDLQCLWLFLDAGCIFAPGNLHKTNFAQNYLSSFNSTSSEGSDGCYFYRTDMWSEWERWLFALIVGVVVVVLGAAYNFVCRKGFNGCHFEAPCQELHFPQSSL